MMESANKSQLDQNNTPEMQIKLLQNRKSKLKNTIEKYRVSPVLTAISAMLGAGCYYLITYQDYYWSDLKPINWPEIIIVGSIFGVGLYLFAIFYISTFYNIRLSQIERELIRLGASELQETIEEDFFNRLVKINFKYLDQYYMQTKEQASKSFIFTVTAAFIGLVILSIGIVLVFMNKITPGYVAAISGIIIEFISSIFFYLYNKTVIKMSDYHKKLVLSQNISLALKITNEFEGDKKYESSMEIVKQLTQDINRYLVETDGK